MADKMVETLQDLKLEAARSRLEASRSRLEALKSRLVKAKEVKLEQTIRLNLKLEASSSRFEAASSRLEAARSSLAQARMLLCLAKAKARNNSVIRAKVAAGFLNKSGPALYFLKQAYKNSFVRKLDKLQNQKMLRAREMKNAKQ